MTISSTALAPPQNSVPLAAPARPAAAAADAPSPPSTLADKVLLGGREGWKAGWNYGNNQGTVATVATLGVIGMAVGLTSSAGAAGGAVGLAAGLIGGALEERYVGVGRTISGLFTGLSGALNGGIASIVKKRVAQSAEDAPITSNSQIVTGAIKGWNNGWRYGDNLGTVSALGAFAHAGAAYALASSADPVSGTVGVIAGLAVGALEERYIGVGGALGGLITGATGAVYGGLAGPIVN